MDHKLQHWIRLVESERAGFDLAIFHGTNKIFDEFLPFSHFGTEAQARMRNSKYVIPVVVRAKKLKRMRDVGSWSKAKMATMRSLERQGYEGVVYLNRYEGIPLEVFQRAYQKIPIEHLDGLSDAQFKKLIPEAKDSYIIFSPNNVNRS